MSVSNSSIFVFSFVGVKKPLSDFTGGETAAAAAAADTKDDDDGFDDLFGSDDEAVHFLNVLLLKTGAKYDYAVRRKPVCCPVCVSVCWLPVCLLFCSR